MIWEKGDLKQYCYLMKITQRNRIEKTKALPPSISVYLRCTAEYIKTERGKRKRNKQMTYLIGSRERPCNPLLISISFLLGLIYITFWTSNHKYNVNSVAYNQRWWSFHEILWNLKIINVSFFKCWERVFSAILELLSKAYLGFFADWMRFLEICWAFTGFAKRLLRKIVRNI